MYKCKYCGKEYQNSKAIGGHVVWCELNTNVDQNKIKEKLSKKSSANKLSDETKQKISESRKRYLEKNPDKVPYLLNHSSKESYPEKYFYDVFMNEGINVVKKHRVNLYELDFSILEYKIDIEIDGEQHYLDKKIFENDIRRNKFLENLGWDIIRIRWAEYQKLSKDDKINYIRNLKNYILKITNEKPKIKLYE